MHKSIFTIFLSILQICMYAQELNWHKHIYSEGRDYVMGVTSDSKGNIYTIGFYSDSEVNIDGTLLPYAERMDSYIAKFSESGELLWTTSLTGIGLFDRVEEIVVDENDDIYVISIMQGEFNIGSEEIITVPAGNAQDFILMKFTSEGVLLFSKEFGGPASDFAYGMTVYPDELLLAGHFNDTFYAGTDSLVSNGRQDMLLISLDHAGELNWMRSYGGENQERLYRAERLENDNIVICGYSTGTFDFGETKDTSTSFFHGFLGLIDPTGNPIRAQLITPTEASSSFYNFRILDNKIYTIANLYDSSFLNEQYYGRHQHQNLIVAQLTEDLEYSWVRSIESMNDTSSVFSFHMDTYSDKIWIPTFYDGQINIADNVFSSDTNDGVFFSITEDGQINNITDLNSGGSHELTHIHFNETSLTIGSVIRGQYSINETVLEASDSDNLLLNYDLSTLVNTSNVTKANKVKFTPNPVQDFIHIDNSHDKYNTAFIYDQNGRLVQQEVIHSPIDVHALVSGIYYLKVTGKDLYGVSKFIKQ